MREAVAAFFANAEGPGGVGIRDRYVAMWGHIAERFAGDSAIAGYDIVNEPNAFTEDELAGLGDLYSDTLVAIRSAEEAAGGESHMVLFEPWALWSSTGEGPLVQWDHDSNAVYSPHIYPGSFTGDPLTSEWFDNAVADAARYGGAPILTGEWGAAIGNHRGTQRVGPDGDDYFIEHQASSSTRRSRTTCASRPRCGIGPSRAVIPTTFRSPTHLASLARSTWTAPPTSRARRGSN